ASSVSRIDPATDKVLATIPTETGSGSAPEGVAITPQAVWVAKHEPVGSILKIEPSTSRIVAEIPVGSESRGPGYITAAPGSVWGNAPGEVVRVDPVTDVVQNLTGPCVAHGGYKIATDGVSLWAPNCAPSVGGITRVDSATNALKTVMPGDALSVYNGGLPPG